MKRAMWINFKEKKLDLRKYFDLTMKGAYYRQQNFIIGLRLQLSLVQDQLVKKILNKILSVPITFINRLITSYKLAGIKDSPQELEEPKLKELSERIYRCYITTSDEKNLEFFNFPFNKTDLIMKIEKEIRLWFENAHQSSAVLLRRIEQIIPEYFEIPKFFTDPDMEVKNYSVSDFESLWTFIFGEEDEHLKLQAYQLSKWNFSKSHEFYKAYRDSTQYSDYIRLQMLEIHSYENAFLDIITSFEHFLAYYFGIIASTKPKKFLNTRGINKNCKKAMKELIAEYKSLQQQKHSESAYKEFITRLVNQERINLGFMSRSLRNYIEDHAGYQILIDPTSDLFEYYNQLRIHRNNLVHPGTLEKSSIPFPHSLDELERVVDQMTSLGHTILDSCQVYEFSKEASLSFSHS